MDMQIKDSLLDLIGGTPMLKLNSLDTGLCNLYVKMESNNPGGSIKDNLSIDFCDANKMKMVFTGIRHFKH